MVNGSCLISGSYLISGSCLISGELSGSRLTRFALGGAARAALHAAQPCISLPWGHGLQSLQPPFSLPRGQGVHFLQQLLYFP